MWDRNHIGVKLLGRGFSDPGNVFMCVLIGNPLVGENYIVGVILKHTYVCRLGGCYINMYPPHPNFPSTPTISNIKTKFTYYINKNS